MNRKSVIALMAAVLLTGSCKQSDQKEAAVSEPPHLEKRGDVTQLIVKGRPWLVLGCELGNSTSSSRKYMASVWPKLKASGVNTVLAVVSWEQTEPVKRQYDFRVVDDLIADARTNGMKLALLWFGS